MQFSGSRVWDTGRFLLLTLALALWGCAEDQTSKKRQGKSQNQNNQQGQLDPNNNNSNFPNGQNNPNNQGNPNNNSYNPLGGDDNCGAKTFEQSFSSSLEKTVTILFVQATISGNGTLQAANKADSLSLDVEIDQINVNPQLAAGIATQEINKVLGKREMFKMDGAGLENLKNRGGSWAASHCIVGMAKSYKFPYGDGTTVTVEFSPALPFAAYPDKLTAEFDSAAQNGLNFEGITGKITNIDGTAPNGFAVGNEYSGSVNIGKDGAGYKVNFNFGSFDSIEKLGLFNFTKYTYENDKVKSVEVEVPILQGADKVNLTFQ